MNHLFRLIAATMLLSIPVVVRAQDTWVAAPSPTTQNLWSVCYGAGQFVAVGEGGTILASPDGAAWTAQASGTTKWLVGVTYASGQFAAVGEAGTIVVSYDGVTWHGGLAGFSNSSGQPLPTVPRLNVIRYILGQWFALGEDGVYANGPLPEFLHGSLPQLIAGQWWRGFAFGKGLYVAAGHVGIAATDMSSQPLFNVYTFRTPSGVLDLEDVIFARDQFLAVGANGAAVKSVDGLTWTMVNPATTASLRGLALFNNTYVAVGDAGTITTSADGDAWIPRASSSTGVFHAVASSDAAAIAVGDHGVIVRSAAANAAPSIVESPIGQNETIGGSAVFRVRALGSLPLTYQWYLNGLAIADATSDTLMLTHLQSAQAGDYSVAVSNSAATIMSSFARLSLVPAPGPGIVDESFLVSPAFTDAPTALLPLADGRLLVAGGRPGQLVRLLANGALDPSFQTVATATVQRLALTADGKILVAENLFAAETHPKLTRRLADGTLDSTFNAGPALASASALTAIMDIAVQPDGRLVVATGGPKLMRLLANGDLDPAFTPTTVLAGSSTDLSFSLLALQADGKILAAGSANLGSVFISVCKLARFNADGTADATFPPQQVGTSPTALRVLANGKIAFAAYISKEGLGFNFARYLRRYNPDGTIDFSSDLPNLNFIPPNFFTVGWRAVQYYPDGRALVSSDFTTADGVARGGIARLNADGTLDPSFHPGIPPPEGVTQIAVAADGKIYFGGAFDTFNGVARPRLVRLNEVATEGTFAPVVSGLSPAQTTVKDGETATLRAAAAGSGSISYQWFRTDRSTDTPFQTTAEPVLTLPAQDNDHAGSANPNAFHTGLYYVKAVNVLGESSSTPVVLTVTEHDPKILSQPTPISAQTGRDLVLTVQIDANTAQYFPQFVWQHNGVVIPNAIDSVLSLSPATAADAGTYTVTVRNTAGVAVTSAPIVVTIDDTSRFVNISTRAFVGAGDQTMIAGFVIAGTSHRTVLVRGIGPGLAQFGVAGALADPQLTLYGPGIPSNFTWDNWGVASGATPALFASLGAFPLDAGSKDAAVVMGNLPPGNYTVQLSSAVPGDTGVGLIEIYEADNLPDRIINLSTRAFVGTNASVTISGIAIRGLVAKKILVRAVGPTLAQFAVNGVLADPTLTLIDNAGATVATNDDWSLSANKADIAAGAAKAGAFALTDPSKDSALLLTLQPGNYTALVSGANSTTGVALVEVYEVP